MQNTNQILNKLITEKDKKENLVLTMEEYEQTPGQKVIVRWHLGDNIWHYHTHGFYEINYVAKGNCINLVEEEPVMMSEGELILIAPGTFHLPYCSKDSVILNFMFEASWFEERFSTVDNEVFDKFMKKGEKEENYRYILLEKKEPSLSEIAEKLIEIAEKNEAKSFILLESTALEFMAELIYGTGILSLSKAKGQNSRTGRELIKYMTDNYADVTLEKVAEYAGYSKTHVCRIFKESVGKSFGDVLADIRISRAKYAMLNTDLPLKSVAQKSGYDSVEYFQRLFKKKTGMTPGKYRKNNSV